MANANSIFQLVLARGALGFVSGTMAAEVAYMADLTWKSDRAYWVNLQARLQAAGCLLGPAIGGMVAPYERKRFESHFQFEHLCYAISALCVLNFVIGWHMRNQIRTSHMQHNSPRSCLSAQEVHGSSHARRTSRVSRQSCSCRLLSRLLVACICSSDLHVLLVRQTVGSC